MRVNNLFWSDFVLSLLAMVAIVALVDGWIISDWSAATVLLILVNTFAVAGLLSLLKDWQVSSDRSLMMVIMGALTAFGGSFIVFLIFGLVARDYRLLEYFPGYLMIFGIAYFASRFWTLGFFSAGRSNSIPIIIYGAGSAGTTLAGALLSNASYRLVGFVDDDPKKRRGRIFGKKVSPSSELARLIKRHHVKEIFLAMPSLAAPDRKIVIERLSQHAVVVKTIPGLTDILSGKRSVSELKPLNIYDLLGRESVDPISHLMEQCIQGKVVLVTGAGGSIGSEIARQALKVVPRQLILLDVSEAALYTIEQDLQSRMKGVDTKIVPALGSVTDASFISEVFSKYAIDTVYHAAAYKHVPLVEQNIITGVYNNVMGTWVTLNAAANANVSHFVLISTDKAVRPTNFMGASKRVAELLVQARASCEGSLCASIVRFGNVLGSSGSVVPLFQRQIDAGGPVTLTHRAITRYFMTIPEASQLVIQAGALAKGGEIFVLDMGEPVEIMTLAEKMIILSGKQVRHAPARSQDEIEIKVTGLRPGEKLYEELLISGNVSGSEHPKIQVAVEKFMTQSEVEELITQLDSLSISRDERGISSMLMRIVEGFTRSASN